MNVPELSLFFPDTHSPLYISVADVSVYPTGFNIVNPTIEITPPNTKTVVLPFNAQNYTIYNSNDVGITCPTDVVCPAVLQDGIWTFKYTITPSTDYVVEKKVLRVHNLLHRFDVAFLKTDIMECNTNMKDQDQEIIDQIDFFIQGAIATANDCNYKKAMDLYREADRMLTNFLKTKC